MSVKIIMLFSFLYKVTYNICTLYLIISIIPIIIHLSSTSNKLCYQALTVIQSFEKRPLIRVRRRFFCTSINTGCDVREGHRVFLHKIILDTILNISHRIRNKNQNNYYDLAMDILKSNLNHIQSSPCKGGLGKQS